jgi:hypothetical protein
MDTQPRACFIVTKPVFYDLDVIILKNRTAFSKNPEDPLKWGSKRQFFLYFPFGIGCLFALY